MVVGGREYRIVLHSPPLYPGQGECTVLRVGGGKINYVTSNEKEVTKAKPCKAISGNETQLSIIPTPGSQVNQVKVN